MNSLSNRVGNMRQIGSMSARIITRVALCSATLYASQIALAGIPNCELVSFLIIIMTLSLGKEMFYTVTVFSLLEGATYGFGLWVLSYLYTWPVLVAITLLLKPILRNSTSMWAVVSGLYGLIFGAFFAIAYVPVDQSYALTYWISGIPWDVWHAFCNFTLMITLGKPVYKVFRRYNE